MKNYQKAEMIAKNLPTGSYAAGCPAQNAQRSYNSCIVDLGALKNNKGPTCQACERTA